jgi:hypothetical protein
MARLVLAVMAAGVWLVLSRNDYAVPFELRDHLWLVGLLPVVYLLCIGLLRE